MNTLFIFPGQLMVQVEDNNPMKQKLPEDLDEYEAELFPHYHVFSTLHLGRGLDTSSVDPNARIIAEVPDDEIRTITLEQLQILGLDMYSPNSLD